MQTRRTILIILTLVFSTGFLRAQTIDTLNQIPENRFKGGQSQFYALLSSTLSYPRSSRSIVGTSVAAVNVTSEGEIVDVSIFASLDEEIDLEIKRAIHSTSQSWLDAEGRNDFVFLLPVTFVTGGAAFKRNPIPDQLCPEVKVTEVASSSGKFKDDTFYQQKYTKEYNKGNLSKALPYLDELIRRNPFDTQQFQNRIRLRILLGSPELACEDYQYMTRVLKQKPLDAPPCKIDDLED